MTRAKVLLYALHLVGNASLLWLGYVWLGMNEADSSRLAGSALVLLVFVLAALWLHGTALALFDRDLSLSFRGAAIRALRCLPWLFLLAVAVAIVYGLLAYAYGALEHTAFVIGSFLTMTIRKPVPPAKVMACFHGFIWLLRWIVVPALAFPMAAGIIAQRSPWLKRRWLYWLEVAALSLCAVWIPLRLLNWIPKAEAFGMQLFSFSIRIGFGYLLFVAAVLALEFFTSSGKPRSSQVSTAASP